MDKIYEIFQKLFNNKEFTPAWSMPGWKNHFLLSWIHIYAHLAIWLAYTLISICILYFYYKRKDLPFRKILLIFGMFLFACSWTHLISALSFWFPIFYLSGLFKVLTAILSWIALFLMWKEAPNAMTIKNPGILEKVIESKDDEIIRVDRDFHEIIDMIPAMTWIADPNGNITWCNHRWFEYTGKTFEILSGWGWSAVHDPKVLPEVLSKWKYSIKTGENFEMEFPIRDSYGNFNMFLNRAVPLKDKNDKIVKWFGINTNVNDSRKANIALIEADVRKTEFISMLGHELRNPLAAIKSAILITTMSTDPKDVQQAIDAIDRQSKHMTRIIDDILDVSRILKRKLTIYLESININIIIDDCCRDIKYQFNNKDIKLIIHRDRPEIIIKADRIRFAQCINNVLHNAFKFTGSEKEIIVNIKINDNKVNISIKDFGIGLDQEMLENLFIPFVQADKSFNRSQGGLGLGLTLTKTLTELQHGTIRAQSEGLNKGTEIIFTFPLQ